MTAAVIATAAVATTSVGIAVSGGGDKKVRAHVALAREAYPLDVRRIWIVDGLSPGESYRLPASGIRNHHGIRTAYRLVVTADATRAVRRPPRRWLHFVPPAVVVDAGRSRAVGLRLELPDDARPGLYGVVLRVRPGGPEGARLTFRIQPAESTRAWIRKTLKLAMWAIPPLVAAGLVVCRVRRFVRADA